MRIALFLLAPGFVLLLSSCAASYKSIDPPTVEYDQLTANDTFAYKFDVLREVGDNKLSRKENKTDIRIAAVKITNNTGRTLLYGINYKIYSGSSEIQLFSPDTIESVIQQSVPSYLLYLLASPLKLTTSHGNVVTSSIPIGLIIGPGLALGNMAVSGTANRKFRTELEEDDIVGRPIKNGETFYGLIGIEYTGTESLTIKIF